MFGALADLMPSKPNFGTQGLSGHTATSCFRRFLLLLLTYMVWLHYCRVNPLRSGSVAAMARLTLVSPKFVTQAIHNELLFQRTQRGSPPSVDSRPTFLEWLRLSWLDILTLIAIGAVAAGVRRFLPRLLTRR